MKSNIRAFTLIELLVVVLIISILAAVALPQYQLAVAKSRVAQVISAVRSLQQAEEIYYLANGDYAQDFEELDINMPTNVPNGWEFRISFDTSGSRVEAAATDPYVTIIGYLSHSAVWPGNMVCWAYRNHTFAKKLCASMGKEQLGDKGGGKNWLL